MNAETLSSRLLYTIQQAAAMLSLCTKTVANLTKRGELRPVRIGRALRYDLEELQAFIQRKKSGNLVVH